MRRRACIIRLDVYVKVMDVHVFNMVVYVKVLDVYVFLLVVHAKLVDVHVFIPGYYEKLQDVHAILLEVCTTGYSTNCISAIVIGVFMHNWILYYHYLIVT